jgi:hypothetical protein
VLTYPIPAPSAWLPLNEKRRLVYTVGGVREHQRFSSRVGQIGTPDTVEGFQ